MWAKVLRWAVKLAVYAARNPDEVKAIVDVVAKAKAAAKETT